MNGIENAQHDISDARFSVDTAIELLSGIGKDTQDDAAELSAVIEKLMELKGGLDDTYHRLASVQHHAEP